MVYIKSEKSKLSPRKPYLITKLYEDKGEQMATLQKSDTQFRQKEYKLKLAEIIPMPGQNVKQTKNDLIEEDVDKLEDNEVKDEFLINNLRTEAHRIVNDLASTVMKASFEETYKHPIDYRRFMEEYEWSDDEILTTTNIDQEFFGTESTTISSKSPTSSSGSYCSTRDSSANVSSDTLTESDSSMPPPPPNTPEEPRSAQKSEI